jgi:hypothetical protein
MAHMANLRRLILDGLVTLVLGYVIKKYIFPLFGKLTEHALLGWLDDKIGDALGINGQTAFDWIVAFGLAAFILYLYHILQVFFFQRPADATHTPGNVVKPTAVQQAAHEPNLTVPEIKRNPVAVLTLQYIRDLGYSKKDVRSIEDVKIIKDDKLNAKFIITCTFKKGMGPFQIVGDYEGTEKGGMQYRYAENAKELVVIEAESLGFNRTDHEVTFKFYKGGRE